MVCFLIAPGAAYGYIRFKGKRKKPAIAIVLISALVVICLEILVLLPAYYSQKYEEIDFSYFYGEGKSGLIHDLCMSALFGLLGVGTTLKMLNDGTDAEEKYDANNQVKSSDDSRFAAENSGNNVKLSKANKEEVEKVKKVFEDLNVFGKQDAVEKEKIIEGLTAEGIEEPEKLFKKYRKWDIIKKYKDKYYFVSNNVMYLSKNYWIGLIIIVIIVTLSASLNDIDNDNKENNSANDTTVISDIAETSDTTAPMTYEEYRDSIDVPDVYIVNNTNLSFNNANNEYLEVTNEDEMQYPFGYYSNSDGTAEFSVTVYSKENISVGLEGVLEGETEYLKEDYDLEDNVEFTKLNGKSYENTYIGKFEKMFPNTNTEGEYWDLIFNAYIVETENYIVEIVFDTERDYAEENIADFDDVLNTLNELAVEGN